MFASAAEDVDVLEELVLPECFVVVVDPDEPEELAVVD